MFLNLLGAAKDDLIRAAASTQPFGPMDWLDSTISFSERRIGRTGTNIVRWIVFLPTALVTSIVMFFIAGAASRQAERIDEGSGLIAGLLVVGLAGFSTVSIGCAVAPDRDRIAAPLVAIFSLACAGLFVYLARLTNDDGLLFRVIVSSGLFSIAVLITAAISVFRR